MLIQTDTVQEEYARKHKMALVAFGIKVGSSRCYSHSGPMDVCLAVSLTKLMQLAIDGKISADNIYDFVKEQETINNEKFFKHTRGK